MIKKIVMASAIAMTAGSSFANNVDTMNAAPIHWGKAPIHASAGDFQNGKSFCRTKYFGQKTCIPVFNNTGDMLTVISSDYGSDSSVANSVATLMGRDKLDTATITIQDTDTDGKISTVYSGPANNREGVLCNQDETTKAISCDLWK